MPPLGFLLSLLPTPEQKSTRLARHVMPSAPLFSSPQAEAKLAHRGEYTKPRVEAFFGWLKQTLTTQVLLPSNPFAQAARYALEREAALKVFLEYPNVPLDTNHLEREIRAIALGRKNWLFCWTEVGAQQVGIVQSLIASCRLQGVDPYVYLVDVLQRDRHPPRL